MKSPSYPLLKISTMIKRQQQVNGDQNLLTYKKYKTNSTVSQDWNITREKCIELT